MRKILVLFIVINISLMAVAQNKGTKKRKASGLPEGYGNVKWGTLVSGAKGQIVGKIVFTDDKTVIRTKDGEMEYLYGFFYVDPALLKGGKGTTDGKLFYVSVSFPYLAMEDVRKKIEEKYGAATGENIRKNQGALLWDSEKTTIVMWVDAYEDKPYCRKITYVGKEIAKEINEYQQKVFSKQELEILEKLSP
jgi:hypothetical protein